jgi:uncharacterized protein with von Willebrand factor type A (vWA) domain
MFIGFLLRLRAAGINVSLREYLVLQEAMLAGLSECDVDSFYYLARAALIKDERNIDKFDQVFAECFKGALRDDKGQAAGIAARDLPEEWLKLLSEKILTADEKAEIAALGGFDRLMETLRQRLEAQRARHEGGSKWIGTAGTSPFGANGYNPSGVRIGQPQARERRAAKVWDKREFRNLAGDVEIGTRTMKLALRRLRRFAREGAAETLDLPGTIGATARNAGTLDLQMVPERHNAVKVLLLLDIGGSMDEHVRHCEQLFSAARSEFKHLVHLYFHNCPYDALYSDARMRMQDRVPTEQVFNTYDRAWKLIVVGDATMGPFELLEPGGALSHWNPESGLMWIERLLEHYPKAAWINPVAEPYWNRTQTIQTIKETLDERMFALTLEGLDAAMQRLMR